MESTFIPMADYSEMWPVPTYTQEFEKNKFVFINRNKEHTFTKPSTVLINPHFKENKKVFVNPKFQIAQKDPYSRPKIHVNPNILRSVSSITQQVQSVNPLSLHNGGSSVMLSSENRIVQNASVEINQIQRIPKPTVPVINTNRFHSQKTNAFCKINSTDNQKIVYSKSKVVNVPQKSQINVCPVNHQLVKPVSRYPGGNELNMSKGNKVMGENHRKVHTRLKIVNVPENKKILTNPITKQRVDFNSKDSSICTRFKYIRKEMLSPKTIPSVTSEMIKPLITNNNHPVINSQNSGSVKTPPRYARVQSFQENNSLRKNAIMTRFKYIRNGAKLMKINRDAMKSKYKIVNTPGVLQGKKNKVKLNSSTNRKKFVYVNKYNSSSFLANNVILKNSKQRNLIKINGILYQNSPCLLKKASLSPKSKFAGANQLSFRSKVKGTAKQVVQHKGKYKIVRSQLASAPKLKKSNMTCPSYKRTGKCIGQEDGTCIKVHNPDLIILCKSFLRGECRNDNCLLSHKVSCEKIETCKYFLGGSCNKVGCQYLHVKISPNAEICKDFLEGFCKEGLKCNKRHQFLCPEFEKTKKCTKTKCPYPHRSSKVIRSKAPKKTTKKILQRKVIKPSKQTVEENCQIRYYKDNLEDTNETEERETAARSNAGEEMAIPKRKKLGSLPSFIPIN
ncbi:uncharacterized protein LOC123314467 [Coccinella septempunctata]|uniref:uncharacterized protein LOC123314467 n=1 Tax=Coccinella septempunctata TaxID=41139 RepID=UPI001D060843|nr:uncharacterized protein LOC123314467 [Coccinella septempunctata]